MALAFGLPYLAADDGHEWEICEGLSERLGWYPIGCAKADQRKTIWVHAVSVGEVLAASRLVTN